VIASDRDPRFTAGFIADVFEVLQRHGYRLPTDEDEAARARGGAVGALTRVVRVYEGGLWEVPDA